MNNIKDSDELANIAKQIRRLTIDMAVKSGTGHIASGLSMCEILATLFFKILRRDYPVKYDNNRDFFLLSKGHGAISLYATLAIKGLITKKELSSYMLDGSRLPAFPTFPYLDGIDFSSGSLGHGLSVAAGIAMCIKHDRLNSRVFAVLSEGDCQEGSTWEAALFSGFHKLDNLVVVIDHNKFQAFGEVSKVMDLHPFAEKWKSFNFSVIELNGHSTDELSIAMEKLPMSIDKPTIIIAHTTKGKGISFMENKVEWHYLPLVDKHAIIAKEQVK